MNLHNSVIGVNAANDGGPPDIPGIAIPNGTNPVPFQTSMVPKTSRKGKPQKRKNLHRKQIYVSPTSLA